MELAVSIFVNPVLRRMNFQSQGQAISMFAARLGKAMPFWYSACFVLLVAEAVIRRHQPGASLLYIACGIWAAVIFVTLIFLVPINNRMMRTAAVDFSEEAQREHRTWDTRHRFRVAALAIAMLCALIAIHG